MEYPFIVIAQLAGALEYTGYISAKSTSSNEYPGFDTKWSDREAPVILELSEMQSNLSFPLLPGRLWSAVVAPDRVVFMRQIELFDIYTKCKQIIYVKSNCLK